MDITTTNMSDDMTALNDRIHQLTGLDLTDDTFAASDTDRCGNCDEIRATAIVQTDWDGIEFGRRCADCVIA